MFTKKKFWQFLNIASVIVIIACGALLTFEHGYVALLASFSVGIIGLSINKLFKRSVAESASKAELLERHVTELSHHLKVQEKLSNVLKKSEEQFRNAFDHASTGMALVAINGKPFQVNSSLCEILSMNTDMLCNVEFQSLLIDEDRQLLEINLGKLTKNEIRSCQLELRVSSSTDDIIWLLSSISLVNDTVNDKPHFIFQLQDITDRKRAEARLVHNSIHDALTNLPNRTLFLDRLENAFKRAKRNSDLKFYVFYFDFDRFKLINDNYGHLIGDHLLIAISERFKTVLRESDTIARLGGDEFVMLIEECESLEDAKTILLRISDEMAKPFDLQGNIVYTTVSSGIAEWNEFYEHADHLLRDADMALYHAKKRGRDRFEIFDKQLQIESTRALQIANDLHRAMEQNELEVHYQPIVELESGKLAGFESLIRWKHPVRGYISPVEFIPYAEETGLILPIGAWILKESCRKLKIWQNRSPEYSDLWVSVNVSNKQFINYDLISLVHEAIQESRLEPTCLKLEITESAMVENIDHVVSIMQELMKLGIKMSIDDFGTGYSSLSNLHQLPLSSLKIDRSFVNQMNLNGENSEIIKTIISLAQSLGLEIIAEGIETDGQRSQLQELQCNFGQGYFFAKPLDYNGIEELLNSGHFNEVYAEIAVPA